FPRRATREQSRRVNFRGHVRQHELDRLKIRDGMSKRLPLLRVGKRGFERALRDAGRLRSDPDAPAVERRERHLVAFAFLSDSIRRRHNAIAKYKLRASRAVNAEFFFFLADAESASAFLNDQRGNSLLPFFGL